MFENCAVKLLGSLEARPHSTFPEILISKYAFGPVKLPGP